MHATLPPHSNTTLTTLSPIELHNPWNVRPALSILYFGEVQPKHDDSAVYEFPFGGSESRPLTQGENGAFTHSGIHRYAYDFGMPIGTPVLAARPGVVVLVIDGFGEGGDDERNKDRANTVFVLQADGTIAEYGHLSKGIPVSMGARVNVGGFLGASGNSGYTRGPHLHFEVAVQPSEAREGDSVPIHFQGVTQLAEGQLYGPFAPSHGASNP